MEDPPNDIQYVVRGLVEKPTLRRQAEVVRKYFTDDVQFYHFYLNTSGGVKDLTAIYQMAELSVNFRGVNFEEIFYDEGKNAMALKMAVLTRPWFLLFTAVYLRIFALLELEDFQTEGGKTVKKIKVQRDYFERSPLLQFIPFFGPIYDSDYIRFLIGGLQASLFNGLRTVVYIAFPPNLWHGVMGLWGER